MTDYDKELREAWDRWNAEIVMPEADAAPVRHGRWKEIDYPWHECSECGERTAVVNLNGKVIWNYCPNCGAKMSNVRCITCIHYEVCGNASMYMDAEKCKHYKEQK